MLMNELLIDSFNSFCFSMNSIFFVWKFFISYKTDYFYVFFGLSSLCAWLWEGLSSRSTLTYSYHAHYESICWCWLYSFLFDLRKDLTTGGFSSCQRQHNLIMMQTIYAQNFCGMILLSFYFIRFLKGLI